MTWTNRALADNTKAAVFRMNSVLLNLTMLSGFPEGSQNRNKGVIRSMKRRDAPSCQDGGIPQNITTDWMKFWPPELLLDRILVYLTAHYLIGHGTCPLHGCQAHCISFVQTYNLVPLARFAYLSHWCLPGQHLHQGTSIYEARDEAWPILTWQPYAFLQHIEWC